MGEGESRTVLVLFREGKKHQRFLQVEFCIMHCSQKLLCSVARAQLRLPRRPGENAH